MRLDHGILLGTGAASQEIIAALNDLFSITEAQDKKIVDLQIENQVLKSQVQVLVDLAQKPADENGPKI